MSTIIKYIIFVYFCTTVCWSRRHNLEVRNVTRRYLALSTFGFYTGGRLEVKLMNFRATPEQDMAVFGFSLDNISDGIISYPNGHKNYCFLEDKTRNLNNDKIIYFILDLRNKKLRVICKEGQIVHIYKDASKGSTNSCDNLNFDITAVVKNGHAYYNASFIMDVKTREEEGLYNLYFHSCPNPETEIFLDFTIEIVEHNLDSYLSAENIPLPALYCLMSLLFLLSGTYWVFLLKQSEHPVYKIHYIMTVLVFIEAVSLGLHGINCYYIERLGVRLVMWTILSYVAHLLQGVLLFVVLILVGTGWTFIKQSLIPRDKLMIVTVILLQVLTNVAEIIVEESKEAAREYIAWRNVFLLADLICCGCTLFPVTWSIRHLRRVSQTDTNLRKLRLFRHFFIMIVCYVYLTRIVGYLLKITVPYQYGWLYEIFPDMMTYLFFALIAYKFSPASQNYYFASNDEKYEKVNQVLIESGATKGLNFRVTKVPLHQQTLTEVTEEEKDILLGKENSHEYD